MNIIDIRTEKLTSEVPVIFLPAWGTTADVYKTIVKEIARVQGRTIVIDEPHGIGIENLSNEERTRASEYGIPEVTLLKVAALLKTIENNGLNRVDVVSHSEGSVIAACASVILKPGKIRKMVLVNPAGMTGEQGISRLVVDTLIDVALQTLRIFKNLFKEGGVDAFKKLLIGGREMVKTFKSDPKYMIKSARVIAKSQIHGLLEIARESGVKISIIHGVDDKVFPIEKVQKYATLKSVNGFYSIQSTHIEPSVHPKKFANVINHALAKLV